MATRAANKRLTREYQTIQKNPPPYIVAHPSENNILEWHYILTGPPETPYENGQYWGTLNFPPDYPFAPPAIRMHTPSGRFQPSTRLCLSISDFHPKSFNPAWEVSTILIGLMSFMTSDEMTTGSISATEEGRKWAAGRSRWWNSTGGGTQQGSLELNSNTRGVGAIKAGDGGAKFREEWSDLDQDNWKWMKERHVDPVTGHCNPPPSATRNTKYPCATAVVRRRPEEGAAIVGAVVEGGQVARDVGRSWWRRYKVLIGALTVFGYVLIARIFGEGVTS